MWYKTMAGVLRQVVIGLFAAALMFSPALAQNSLMPDGKQQFLGNTGVPLASGKVYMYVPNTSTFKNTWQDAAGMTLNTNPITLDSSGRALIYGSGIYRQLVTTSTGVTIYDALTTSTLTQGDLTIFIGNATSTGTANAQIIAATTPTTFALTTGYTLTFKPGFANTGATQINVASTGLRNLMKPSSAGPTALTGGELVANQVVQVVYDGTQYVLNTPLPPLELVNAQTGTTYTFLNSDSSKLVTAFNAAAQAYTLPQAGAASSFLTGWFADIHNKSTNAAGVVTITPTTSTIDGAATLVLQAGGFARIVSDGTNYQIAYKLLCVPSINTCPIVANPTVQRFTSGTGAIYTAPTNPPPIRQRVRMAAGGGGGGAVATNNGASGTATSFQVNSTGTAWTAALGAGGAAANGAGGAGGSGGTDGSTGTLVFRSPGQSGTAGANPAGAFPGSGGQNFFGGAGLPSGTANSNGQAAVANTGGGGAGATGGNSGGGGGAGEYVELWVTGMTTATYTVGALGAGGAAGTAAGGNGAAGIIIVEEFYQKFMRSVCGDPANDNYNFEMCKVM